MNAPTHKLGAGLALLIAAGIDEWRRTGQISTKPLLAGLGGYCFGTLPDKIEPATSPNHRQFFHSIAFAGIVGLSTYELYHWEPTNELERFLKGLGLVMGGAYLIHLAMDFTTRKSLPII